MPKRSLECVDDDSPTLQSTTLEVCDAVRGPLKDEKWLPGGHKRGIMVLENLAFVFANGARMRCVNKDERDSFILVGDIETPAQGDCRTFGEMAHRLYMAAEFEVPEEENLEPYEMMERLEHLHQIICTISGVHVELWKRIEGLEPQRAFRMIAALENPLSAPRANATKSAYVYHENGDVMVYSPCASIRYNDGTWQIELELSHLG